MNSRTRVIKRSKRTSAESGKTTNGQSSSVQPQLKINEEYLRNELENCADVNFRIFKLSSETVLIVHVPNLTDTDILDRFVINPLFELDPASEVFDAITNRYIAIGVVEQTGDMDKVIDAVLEGQTVVLVDSSKEALLLDVQKWEMRSIEEPSSESLIRGPKDGFTETINVNISLLRRRLKTRRFKLESLTVGELSRTTVCLAYIEGIVKPDILGTVRDRIKSIKLDVVLDSHFIEEMIEDAPYSPYPQIQYTERPDVVVSCMSEGKIAILVDNTPNVLIVPFTFWGGFQSAEDFYERFTYTSAIRITRLILLNISIFVTPMYVAIVTFHPQLLPTPLMLNIVAAREPSPFPTLVEAGLMEFIFEGLREAGVRLPRAIGSAVSIVGGLVLGQAAVQAGLVSAPIVIIVATGGVASFAIPRYNFGFAYRLLRFPLLIFGGSLGLFGIVIAFLLILAHQVNLTSVGVPYLSPVAPEEMGGLKDVFIRGPRWSLNDLSPKLANSTNTRRIPKGQRPGRDETGKDR